MAAERAFLRLGAVMVARGMGRLGERGGNFGSGRWHRVQEFADDAVEGSVVDQVGGGDSVQRTTHHAGETKQRFASAGEAERRVIGAD